MTRMIRTALASLAAASTLTLGLAGCAPLIVGGAMVGSAMVAIDRRTAGTQVEDEAIELKTLARAREASGASHVNATSYNRMLLLTGEVPSEAERRAIELAASRVDNVRSVINELAVSGNTSLGQRSNDTVISGKVKAGLIDAKDLQANAIKVVTERGTVYLMGLVTEREAARATEVARGVSGVLRVIRVFEIITEAELAKLQPRP